MVLLNYKKYENFDYMHMNLIIKQIFAFFPINKKHSALPKPLSITLRNFFHNS